MENRMVKLLAILIFVLFLGGCTVLDTVLGGYYLIPEADIRITSIDPNYLEVFWDFDNGSFVIGDFPTDVRVTVKQLNPVSARFDNYNVTYFDKDDNPLWDLFLSGSLGVFIAPIVVESPSDYPEYDFSVKIITKNIVKKALEEGYTYLNAKVVLKGTDDAQNPLSLDFSVPIEFELPPEDTIPPVVAINVPNNSVYTTQDLIDIEATVWDDYYVKRIELYIDDSLIAVSQSGETSISYYWDLANANLGNHTIKVVAYDFAGNQGVNSITVLVKPEEE